jgi:hypothetical protein
VCVAGRHPETHLGFRRSPDNRQHLNAVLQIFIAAWQMASSDTPISDVSNFNLMSVALLPSVSPPRCLLMTLTIDEKFLSTPEVVDPMHNAYLVTIARSCSRG